MKASICMATHNKPHLLKRTLESIFAQTPSFEFEVIVVDDGPKDNAARDICKNFPVRYHRIEREHVFRNPCVARNVGFKLASGEVIIAQSDEVAHVTPDCIERLVRDLTPGHILLANVFCRDANENVCGVFIGPTRQEPFFFLGSVFREDLYAVGGNDEDFIICPAWEDNWFGDCLTRGRGLTPVYTTHIIGHHLFHEYFSPQDCQGPSKTLYHQKKKDAERGTIKWEATGGPWPYVPNQPYHPPTTEEIFTAIYKQGVWSQGTESLSGTGSSLDATKKLREKLPHLIRERKIKSVLDIPCGDWHWMREVGLPGVRYTGADIVPDLIEGLVKRYASKTRKFRQLDLLSDKLPKVDLVFCRDCLGHLSPSDVERALTNIVRSGSKYLLATTFPPRDINRPIQTGDWTPYNLQVPPFDLPEPLEIINEDCREYYPDFNDKSMGLWRIADLDRPALVKSLVVCVEYDDFLAITLPRNMRHFSKTLVVTSPADTRTQELAKRCGAEVYVTDAFYRNGAAFNKGAAVEEAFDVLGRDGWICVWDADIVMPDSVNVPGVKRDCLYVPTRRLVENPKKFSDSLDWNAFASPTQPNEFDGYFQLFHASAPLAKPWYSVDWSHAGGGDSDFQSKFPEANRCRPPFDVLHLGTEGIKELGSRVGLNWQGRVTPRIDTGEVTDQADERKAAVCQMIRDRERHGTVGEKIPAAMPKRISYFWSGRMSWMRYLTLASFRWHNPDWEIRLYSPAEPCGLPQWRTSESDDSTYTGEDYRERLGDIGVECHQYSVPIPGVAPAQASDLFQWDLLGHDGGFYADMDILWLKSLEPIRTQVEDADAVFCLEAGVLAIGFLAANHQCQIFRDFEADAGAISDYQGFGTHLVLRKFKDKNGQELIKTLREQYPALKILTVPDQTVYPFDWREIEKIFASNLTPPPESYGLHWFGGSKLTQQWNRKLTAENYRRHINTFTNCVRMCTDNPK